MTVLRLLMAAIFVAIAAVTVVVVRDHGINLFPVFFGDIRDLTWRGQFNVDFMCFFVLSALWLAWRHDFAPVGWILSVFGFFGGAFFLSAYVFVQSYRVQHGLPELLLGARRFQQIANNGS